MIIIRDCTSSGVRYYDLRLDDCTTLLDVPDNWVFVDILLQRLHAFGALDDDSRARLPRRSRNNESSYTTVELRTALTWRRIVAALDIPDPIPIAIRQYFSTHTRKT